MSQCSCGGLIGKYGDHIALTIGVVRHTLRGIIHSLLKLALMPTYALSHLQYKNNGKLGVN